MRFSAASFHDEMRVHNAVLRVGEEAQLKVTHAIINNYGFLITIVAVDVVIPCTSSGTKILNNSIQLFGVNFVSMLNNFLINRMIHESHCSRFTPFSAPF